MDARRIREPRLTAVAVAGTLVVVTVFVTFWLRGRSLDVQYGLYLFHNGPPAVLLLWLGRLVMLRQPGNRIGAVLIVIAALGALHTAIAAIADKAIVDYGYTAAISYDHPLIPAQMPLSATIPLWIMNWLWVPQVVLVVTVLPLLFPDGRLPGRRWRVALAVTAVATVSLLAATVIDGWPTGSWGVADPPAVVTGLFAVGGVNLLGAALAGLSAMVVRWRGADEMEREPFQIVGVSAGVLALTAIATYPWQGVWIPATLVAMYQLFAAYALAVARFRLHDVEPVLGKDVFSRALSLPVAVAYLAVVIGLGAYVIGRIDHRIAGVLGVAVAAVLVVPLHRLVRQLLDRHVLGRHHDRAGVVSRLVARTAEATPTGMLDDAARLLLRGSGAQRVEIWLDGRDEPVAAGRARPRGAIRTAEVVHAGQTLGRIDVHTRAARDLPPDTAVMIADVSHILGVALHNERLGAQLRDRLDDLQASRKRIVQAHDEARRLLERDLHDGAQAQLISLRLQIGTLQAQQRQTEPDDLDQLASRVDDAVQSLRELSRGVHPPILDEAGPGAALIAQARHLTVPVIVKTTGRHRHEAAVESAVYFSALEAIQNAVRHGCAARIVVTIAGGDGRIEFEVSDDGIGFEPTTAARGAGLRNMDDRIRALGGDVTIDSDQGHGTTVTGWIPAQPLADDR